MENMTEQQYCPECDMRQEPGKDAGHMPKCSRAGASYNDGLTVTAILSYLTENGPTKTKILRQQIDGSVSFALASLEKQGRAERPVLGLWSLPGDERVIRESDEVEPPAKIVSPPSKLRLIQKSKDDSEEKREESETLPVMDDVELQKDCQPDWATRLSFMFPDFDGNWSSERQALWYESYFKLLDWIDQVEQK